MYRCPDCGQKLMSMRGVKQHRKRKHKTVLECDNEYCEKQWHGLCTAPEVRLFFLHHNDAPRLVACQTAERVKEAKET